METNVYLNQVVEEQARVEDELRQRRLGPAAPAGQAPRGPGGGLVEFKMGMTGLEDSSVRTGGVAVDYRITGFWRWKTVVVPPNVYVVHTRRGQAEPLHIGLGISFRYNPATDAFLVIPAAVQTLLINARCICAERQGVLVQAYVQWIVDNIGTAYRKLDFSDPADPMRIVNVQLREQAEAAIKDKVATMPIDAVLSDKQPIIDELTSRLRAVAEGTGSTGLGLKIVTVQIKEAVVSSTRLWENLQKPFRAEREKVARMAELEAQQEIARRELAYRQARESAELETARQLDLLRAEQEREVYDRAQAEKMRRHQLEQSAQQQALAERTATEKAQRIAEEELALQQHEMEARRLAREREGVQQQLDLERARAELERLRTSNTIERDNLTHSAASDRTEREISLFRLRREAENELSEQHVKAQLIARLPDIASAMPQPEEVRSISIGPDGGNVSLAGFLAGVLQVVESTLKRSGVSNGSTGARQEAEGG
jgi:hypothetical protein